jgi:chromosomal replication initiator protein
MTKEELWQAVLAQVQLNISPANFTTWFKNTSIASLNDNEVVISVPNSFVKEWLEQKYNKTILKILRGLDETIKGTKYIIGKSDLKILKEVPIPRSEIGQLEFQEFKTDKETGLNPRYTFANFVVGSFNELAHAAARAVAENPGTFYNPLFIYGGVGLGKTHLLQAIGNEVVKKFPQKRVKYIPSEKFVSGVITSIRNKQIESFKLKHQKVEVLIIDDVQFLAGKEKTQEEFFHIFNSLYEKNNQIVLSSDKPPRAIQALTERLKSRFEGGMIADISLPDLETRVAILKEKGREKEVEIQEDILDYIASNIKQNIRELEGALNRLIIYRRLNNKFPDLETAKTLLKDLVVSTENRVISAKKIIQATAEFYDLRERDLLLKSRRKEIVKPRQVAMYLLREELKSSFPFIGRKFGGKDHTTAIYAYEKMSKEIGKNEALNQEINLIKQRVYGG